MEIDSQSFERQLSAVCDQLTAEAVQAPFPSSPAFERAVRDALSQAFPDFEVNFDPHPHAFPDVSLGRYGVEIKFTQNDTWRSVANSVFEGRRDQEVEEVYVVFGKIGGVPEVRWDRYDRCVMHVRTSHVPRFELDLDAEESFFSKMDVPYSEFALLSPEEKMKVVREYARGRLKEGEKLWWLGDDPDSDHTLPAAARLYMSLDQPEKKRMRAEAALLCPQIVKPSRAKKKYDDAALYLLTYRGVLCTQVRDLFSAGSVAMASDKTRGGNYVQRSLADIEVEMRDAAAYLEPALFVEYWGEDIPPEDRIDEWLRRADEYADDWTPSADLFVGTSRKELIP